MMSYFSDATLYRWLVESLIYLTVTQLYLSHALHLVSQFRTAPRFVHYAAILRILHYVKGTFISWAAFLFLLVIRLACLLKC
jgi:hypothetical protein